MALEVNEPLRKLAADAYDSIQYACNISGVVKLLTEQMATGALVECLRPSEWLTHPIVCAIVDKLDDLARTRAMAPPVGEPGTWWAALSSLNRVLPSLSGLDTRDRNTHPEVQAGVLRLVRLTQSRTRATSALEGCQRLAHGSGHEQLLVSLSPLLYHDTRDVRLYQWLLVNDSVIHKAWNWAPNKFGVLNSETSQACEARGFLAGVQAMAAGPVSELTAAEWAQWQAGHPKT